MSRKNKKSTNNPSLNTKVELIGNINRIYNSSQRLRTLARNMKKISALLQPPYKVQGKYNTRRDNFQTAHVYLTVGGIVDERSFAKSICSHRKQPVTMVKWGGRVSTTAKSLAHGLGQLLGMGHDTLAREIGEEVMNYGG